MRRREDRVEPAGERGHVDVRHRDVRQVGPRDVRDVDVDGDARQQVHEQPDAEQRQEHPGDSPDDVAPGEQAGVPAREGLDPRGAGAGRRVHLHRLLALDEDLGRADRRQRRQPREDHDAAARDPVPAVPGPGDRDLLPVDQQSQPGLEPVAVRPELDPPSPVLGAVPRGHRPRLAAAAPAAARSGGNRNLAGDALSCI
jgi:hypothetical protein